MAKKQTKLLKYKYKKPMVDNLTLLENGDFVDYYCVKIDGTIFSNAKGIYKFAELQDALDAQLEIDKLVQNKIKEIEQATKSS